MAGSLAAAIAKAEAREGKRWDRAVGYLPAQPVRVPTPEHVLEAFEPITQSHIDHLVHWLIKDTRCSEADAREAALDTFERLLRKRPEVFHWEFQRWWRLLYATARFRVFEIRSAQYPIVLTDRPAEPAREAAASAERSSLPVTPAACDYTWVELPADGEEWTSIQIIGALQRYARHYEEPPREIDCRALHRLPPPATIRARFGSFGAALAAAGLPGRSRRRLSSHEGASMCRSFRRRHGRWPDTSDFHRGSGELPSARVATRIFGSTRSGVVQQRAEEILGLAPA